MWFLDQGPLASHVKALTTSKNNFQCAKFTMWKNLMLASCWCQAAKCETKMWLKTKCKSTKLANETKSVLPCLWNLWLATKPLPSNKDYPSICPHPSEYRLLAFSAASVSGPQWKENSLCRCVPHPQPLTNGSIKAAILLSVRRRCSGCISRHQARPTPYYIK